MLTLLGFTTLWCAAAVAACCAALVVMAWPGAATPRMPATLRAGARISAQPSRRFLNPYPCPFLRPLPNMFRLSLGPPAPSRADRRAAEWPLSELPAARPERNAHHDHGQDPPGRPVHPGRGPRGCRDRVAPGHFPLLSCAFEEGI